ncbi:ubiquitin carboxyl-terminal hydrolase 19 [Grosmannia clavigera kw1407]|uniref:Ubiquitin carboxyl-terminal hydrolase 19 n=1 Tax=Grosmannia clavigera (strain kw1407 / UAMH 11150) TaxID=655863 RepID=F0XPS8_GROCL|nr:ubiquitin carboxyl-terminal hydrolase 19 [Grosmannia clavigera kw1407]EFX00241.1 ubiquitin carboxyl-terminal hydrolase 19 [Grosmannia clavigera kw1407]
MAAPYPQVVLFGDSLFERATETKDGFCFQAALQSQCGRVFDVVNRGFSGYNTSQALKILPKVFPDPASSPGPKLAYLLVLLGANDAALPRSENSQHVDLQEYEKNLKTILTHPNIRAHKPKILVVTPPPLDGVRYGQLSRLNGETTTSRQAPITAQYAEAARRAGVAVPDVTVIDFWKTLMDRAVSRTPGFEAKDGVLLGDEASGKNGYLANLLADGLHLSGEGYRLLFEDVRHHIEQTRPESLSDDSAEIFRPSNKTAIYSLSSDQHVTADRTLILGRPPEETNFERNFCLARSRWLAREGQPAVAAGGLECDAFETRRYSRPLFLYAPSYDIPSTLSVALSTLLLSQSPSLRPDSGMDTRFVVSREEFHNVQMDVRQIHAVQASQNERLLRLEKRYQDDSAIRSAWSNSPFPSALVGTPQHGPVRMPSTEAFDLDEQSQTLGSLHLDPDDEPVRRAAAASRANSVRFDESANMTQNARHFSDMGPFRPGSSLMMERSLSHKSDGRHSSAGHSVHSMASGRGSSIALETNYMTGGHEQDSPLDMPEPPPVFFVLGSVPAIIRCWLTEDFASDTLLYAAVCSGAQKSTVELSLIKELGLTDLIYRDVDNAFKIHLQTYLAEAIPATRSADPVPQIPSLSISFEVASLDQTTEASNRKKGIRIIIGSDTLRTHSADVLFSRNLLCIYSREREKLSVPFVRPEDDAIFKNLYTSSVNPEKPKLNAAAAEFIAGDLKSRGSIDDGYEEEQHVSREQQAMGSQGGRHRQEEQSAKQHDDLAYHKQLSFQEQETDVQIANGSLTDPGDVSPTTTHVVPATKWPRGTTNLSDSGNEGERQPRHSTSSERSGKEAGPTSGGSQRNASAIWGSWRQVGSTTGSDGGHRENGSISGYQPPRQPRTMKVLKAKTGGSSTSVRTGSSYEPPLPSRSGGEHRSKSQAPFNSANDGGNGGGGGGNSSTASNVIRWESKRTISISNAVANNGVSKENKSQQGLAALELRNSTTPAPRTSNPVGGASAFAWMKPNKPKTPTAAE